MVVAAAAAAAMLGPGHLWAGRSLLGAPGDFSALGQASAALGEAGVAVLWSG